MDSFAATSAACHSDIRQWYAVYLPSGRFRLRQRGRSHRRKPRELAPLAATYGLRETMFLNLAGKSAIVTGAGQGIGFAIAERLAQAGARVVIADIGEEKAQEAAGRLRSGGGEAHAIAADVTRPEAVAALAERTLSLFGQI